MKRDLVVACSLSLLLCIFVNAYSTGDIEESTKISYSVAVNDSSNGKSGGPRTVGTYSYFGVPLYDALQGTGNRLPYQASWAQSPEWPLRFLVSKQQFVLIRIFFSSLLLHLAAFRLLRSWTSNLSLARQVLFGLLLQTLAGLYVRQLEWSDTYSQSVGILGITFVLLHRSNFVPRQLTDRGILRSASDVLIVFGCVALVVTGHPGVFPIAAFVLIPVLLTCLWVSPVFRWRLAQTVRNSPLELALIFAPALFLVGVVSWDLAVEGARLPDWTASRSVWVQGLWADQALRGFSRGVLPDFVEQMASLILAFFLLPLLRLTHPWLQETDFVTRMAGSFPRGEFTGALVLLAALRSGSASETESPERALQKIVLISQTATFLLALLSDNRWLPLVLTTSATYMFFPVLLVINVFMTFVVLGNLQKTKLLHRVIGYSNVCITGAWLLMQFSVLTIYPTVKIKDAERFDRVELLPADYMSMREVLSDSGRLVFFSSPNYASQADYTHYIKLVQQGLPVLSPADAKIRDVNHLQAHSFTNGRVDIPSTTREGLSGTDQLLAFLQVQHVMVEFNDPLATDVQQFVMAVNSTNKRSDTIREVEFVGKDFLLWKRTSFVSNVLRTGSVIGTSRCPLLESDCAVMRESLKPESSDSPRLKLCQDSCLWRYLNERALAGQTLVLPISYDDALDVHGPQGMRLKILNVAGLLGVVVDSVSQGGMLEISIRPDTRMYLRIISSYLQLAAFLTVTSIVVWRHQRNRFVGLRQAASPPSH